MSRKTRKLMWSVPLIAAVAVIGALSLFLTLQPNGASAQEIMVPGPVTDLDAEVKNRTSIELTWEAPDSSTGGTPTGYRVDHSSDNREWMRLEDNTNSTAARYLVDTGVTATTEKYYRVFAINQAGTGPVSVDPVTAYASVPRAFPPTVPGRATLSLRLDDDDPYGKINLSWTEAEHNGSPVTDYKIVEMIDHDRDGRTARVECGEAGVTEIAGDLNATPPITAITLVPFNGDPDDMDNDALNNGQYCLQIENQDADEDRMAMHAGLTGGESHYYRVIAINNVDSDGGAPSDTKGIATRTPRNPDTPTEPVAVPIDDSGMARINLYWLEPVSNGGHSLADFRVEVQARVLELDSGNVVTTKWGAWSEWASLNNAAGEYAAVTFIAKNGTTGGQSIPLTIMEPMGANADADAAFDPDGAATTQQGSGYNLRVNGAVNGQYKFQIRAKQSGTAARGLNLGSRWVTFNRGDSITVPVAPPATTEIPLVPKLTAKALDAELVRDQGIGLTWDPNVGVDFDHDGDPNTATVKRPNFSSPDYRIDVSKDGLKWTRGQTRTISLRKWDHEGLKSEDIRYYRLFPINHGDFGEADVAGAQAEQAVIASPDTVLNLRQRSATTTTITMEWDEVSAAAKYQVYWGQPGENDELPTGTGAWKLTDPETTELDFFTDVSEGLNPGDSRWYRVVPLTDADKPTPVQGADGAEALGKTTEAGSPGMPVGLVAQEAFDSSLTNSDDRGVLLLWAEPEDEGKDPHTSYTVEWKSDTMTGDAWEVLVADTDNLDGQTPKSTHYHHDVELGTDEQRAYRVSALSGSGSGMASNVSYYPAMAGMEMPAMPGMPGNAMSLMAGSPDDNDPAAIKLTWEAGANATTHTVAGVLRNADGTFDTSAAIWMTDVTSPLKVEMDPRPAGTYIFGVVAGLIDGTDREWSDWARATVAYPQ